MEVNNTVMAETGKGGKKSIELAGCVIIMKIIQKVRKIYIFFVYTHSYTWEKRGQKIDRASWTKSQKKNSKKDSRPNPIEHDFIIKLL